MRNALRRHAQAKLNEDCSDVFALRALTGAVLRVAAARAADNVGGAGGAAAAFDKGVVEAVHQMFAAAGVVAALSSDSGVAVSALRAGIDVWARRGGSAGDVGSGIPSAWFELLRRSGRAEGARGTCDDRVSVAQVLAAIRRLIAKADEYAMQVESAVEDALLMRESTRVGRSTCKLCSRAQDIRTRRVSISCSRPLTPITADRVRLPSS